MPSITFEDILNLQQLVQANPIPETACVTMAPSQVFRFKLVELFHKMLAPLRPRLEAIHPHLDIYYQEGIVTVKAKTIYTEEIVGQDEDGDDEIDDEVERALPVSLSLDQLRAVVALVEEIQPKWAAAVAELKENLTNE